MFQIFVNLKTLLTSFVFPCCFLVLSHDFYDLKACPFMGVTPTVEYSNCGVTSTVTLSSSRFWDSGVEYRYL